MWTHAPNIDVIMSTCEHGCLQISSTHKTPTQNGAACAFSIIFCSATNLAEHTNTHTYTRLRLPYRHISACCAWSPNTHAWTCERMYTSAINFCIRLFELFMRVESVRRRHSRVVQEHAYVFAMLGTFFVRPCADAHIT